LVWGIMLNAALSSYSVRATGAMGRDAGKR
jgi:hypothetical protein